MNNKTVNKAFKNVVACHSFKGNDFCCCGDRRHVKKVTRRANRRLNRAICNEAV